MRCPDCGGKKHRRNPDLHLQELERQFAGGNNALIAPIIRAYLRQGRAPDLDADGLALLQRHGGDELLFDYLMARVRHLIRMGQPLLYPDRPSEFQGTILPSLTGHSGGQLDWLRREGLIIPFLRLRLRAYPDDPNLSASLAYEERQINRAERVSMLERLRNEALSGRGPLGSLPVLQSPSDFVDYYQQAARRRERRIKAQTVFNAIREAERYTEEGYLDASIDPETGLRGGDLYLIYLPGELPDSGSWRPDVQSPGLYARAAYHRADLNDARYCRRCGDGDCDIHQNTVERDMLNAISRIIYQYYNNGSNFARGDDNAGERNAHSFLVNGPHGIRNQLREIFNSVMADDDTGPYWFGSIDGENIPRNPTYHPDWEEPGASRPGFGYFTAGSTSWHNLSDWQQELLARDVQRTQDYGDRFAVAMAQALELILDYIEDQEEFTPSTRGWRKYTPEIYSCYVSGGRGYHEGCPGVFSSKGEAESCYSSHEEDEDEDEDEDY